MKELVDLSGQKFNKLTVVSLFERKRKKWNCVCDCGTESVVEEKNLKSGNVKSCGCTRILKIKSRIKDLSGEIFGRLTVISKSEREGRYWDCLCECGQTTTTLYSSLICGRTKSCGCLYKETTPENIKSFIRKARELAGLDPEIPMSSENKLERLKFIPIAKDTYKRDLFSCIWCSKTKCKLHAHHIETWAASPEKRFDKTNVVSLCSDCHMAVHNWNYFSFETNSIMSILLQGYVNFIESEPTYYRLTPN